MGRKFNITAFAALLMGWSCTTDMGLLNVDGPRELAVSSVMIMDETSHHVFVGWSDPRNVSRIKDSVSVYCKINGGAPVYASEVRSEVMRISRHFALSFDFLPGDNVELYVEVPSLHMAAHGEATAVDAVPITKVDTSSVRAGERYRDYRGTIHFGEGITDRKCLMALPLQGISKTKDGPDGEIMFVSARKDTVAWFDRTSSLFAYPDLGLPEEMMDILGIPYQINDEISYAFTNSNFKGMDQTLGYDFSDRVFCRVKTGLYYDRLYVEPTAIFRLGTMDDVTYHYLNCIDKMHYWANANGGMFGEPLILPENIEDGIGFFGLVSTSSQQIHLPQVSVREDIWQ